MWLGEDVKSHPNGRMNGNGQTHSFSCLLGQNCALHN